MQFHDHLREQAQYIQAMVDDDLSLEEFYQSFVRSVVTALQAEAGAVWLLDSFEQGTPTAEVGLTSIGFFQNADRQIINSRIVSAVIATGESKSIGPEDELSRPTDHVILLVGLHDGEQSVGALQVFQRSSTTPSARPGMLQFLEQMAGQASRFLQRRRSGATEISEVEFRRHLEQFALALHQSLELKQVCATAVNDGQLILNCERASLALRHGPRRVRIHAVSGQDAVNQRSNLMQRLAAVTVEVMNCGEPLAYHGRVDDLPSSIEELLANYLEESASRFVLFVPFFPPRPLHERAEEHEQYRRVEHRDAAIGCFVVELFSTSRPSPVLAERAEHVATHIATAVHNARNYEDLFLLSLWRFLGRLKAWFRGRRLAISAVVILGTLLLALAMIYLPWDYRVEADGRLMPVIQRAIYAPWDGEVEEILVDGGSVVQAGAVLVQLRNEEQHAELVQARNELDEHRKELLGLSAELDRAILGTDRSEEIRIQGRIAQTQVEINRLREHVSILEKREAALSVRAPISGVVADFQLEQLLSGRPVARGETLLELMDDRGSWHLELQIPEKRMGHILQAQQNGPPGELPVEFILATAPEKTFYGRLVTLSTRSELSESNGSIVEAFAAINDDLPMRRIGATVHAKISCGKRNLGYVLFGDVIEFVRRRLWW